MASRTHLLLFLAVVLLVPGCGGPQMAKVKGRILCNGKPVAEAAVTFNPVPENENSLESGKPATGFSDPDGYYELSTYKALDGALVGTHRVTIVLDDTNKAKCKRETKRTLEVKPGTNELNVELNE